MLSNVYSLRRGNVTEYCNTLIIDEQKQDLQILLFYVPRNRQIFNLYSNRNETVRNTKYNAT